MPRREYEIEPVEFTVEESTLRYYSDHVEELSESAAIERPVYIELLKGLLEDGATVLDVGAGTGRDVHLLNREGFDVLGVDPNAELIARGSRRFGIPEGRLKQAALPDLQGITGRYDAVLCSLVLQHLSDTALLDALYSLKQRVADGGVLLVTVPKEAPQDAGDIRYLIRPPERYQFFLTRLGLDLVREMDLVPGDEPGATPARLMLFVAGIRDGLRPIETLESILIEDRKANSYKFALLRALADVATHKYNAAQWRPGGLVAIDIDLIARHWIEYYWPIVAAEERGSFVLQGQRIKGKADVTFREPLRELVRAFGEGGLSAFLLALESNRLSTGAKALYKATLTKVRSGIDQPVQYSGNDRTGAKVFQREGRRILVPAELWSELSVMGRWVADSVILRWAEFTVNLKHQSPHVTKEQVVSLLLQRSAADRKVDVARAAYERVLAGRHSLTCVWSGAALRRFDVDHAIPFALWGNNDLWNLLPAAPNVNSAKSDRLPSRNLVEARRRGILEAWEHLYVQESALFLRHTGDFVGEPLAGFAGAQRATLFATFKDAIEYTAQNRVAERWDGPG
ncbi:MAG: methyltransferase domain-containing protein [Spirochaetes bacterium]|jgi:2-polyprenyl-3-methyl-5-hydroxy-6-metoxy-1,4-benzoquinol methylase|nr:methyltransferase domain-containing protein [Spirochaetota bacterium]